MAVSSATLLVADSAPVQRSSPDATQTGPRISASGVDDDEDPSQIATHHPANGALPPIREHPPVGNDGRSDRHMMIFLLGHDCS